MSTPDHHSPPAEDTKRMNKELRTRCAPPLALGALLFSSALWGLPALDQVADAGYCDPLPSPMQVSVVSQCLGCTVDMPDSAADDDEASATLLRYPAGAGRIVLRLDLQPAPVSVESGVIGALVLQATTPKNYTLEIRLISGGSAQVGRSTIGNHLAEQERAAEFFAASAPGSFDAIEFDYQVTSQQPTTLELLEVCTR